MSRLEKRPGSRKQITFDLSQERLRQRYPKPSGTINPNYYKKAYADIRRFMKKNGFEHRQFSVYVSKEQMTAAKIIVMMRLMAKDMPWLAHCVNQIDVTSVGAQHSLLPVLADSGAAVELETAKCPVAEYAVESRPSLREQLASAQVEADCRNQARAAEQTEHIHHKPEYER